jgi:hypothetical protein
MPKQLEIVKYRDVIPVTSIPRFVPDLGYLAIEVHGEDFSSVESVYINDVRAPEFIILNSRTMYVQLPEAAQSSISSIEVVSSRFTHNASASKLSFELGNKTKTVSGLLKLVQLFTKWILQSPNSDIFNPERGGGLQELVGHLSSDAQMNVVLSSVDRAVQNTVTQIRSAQTKVSGLPLEERLLTAEVADFSVQKDQMSASVKVVIRSAAGQIASTALIL